MTVTVVGVGLIGGSMAIGLRELGIAKKLIGVGHSEASLAKALELKIIDEALPLEAAVKKADIIYIAIPVDSTVDVVVQVLNLITDKQIVIDAGSTKFALCDAIKNHSMRKR